jgi:hypothetical protein
MKPVTAQTLFQCTQDHEEYLQVYVRRFLRLRAQAPIVPNEIVIEAMIKGLRPGPMTQYFTMKPPQTLEKLLQKMDEYIRADNDFRQRREEAYRFSEMTRGFGGRIHPRHVRSIHSSSQNDDKGSRLQRSQHTSQFSGQQQSSFRPPAPRGRGGRGFGGRYGDQPRKIYCLFCGEDKGHTTRACQITIPKQKKIAEAKARQNQPKQVLHTASYHSPYIPEYVGNHPAASVASASHSQASWPQLPPPPPLQPTYSRSQQPEGRQHSQQQREFREESEARTVNILCQNQSTYTERYPTSEILLCSMPFFFLIRNKQCKFSFNFLYQNGIYLLHRFTKLKSYEAQKSFLWECRAKITKLQTVVPKGAQRKFCAQKDVPKGMQS